MEPVVNYDHKTIQMRRGTTAEWRRYGAICIPAEGEICIEFFQESSGQRNGLVGLKVGNGESSYTNLPYLITNQNQDDRISDEQITNWDLTVEKLANLTAAEIDQKNVALGDNVQEALDDLHSRLLAIDPDGGSIEINDIGGLEDALNNKADKDHTHDEYLTDAPNDGNQYVRQSQAWAEVTIPDGGSAAWDDITGKPTEFPPEAHNQDWSTITNTPSEYPPESHTHGQSDVDGLEDRLDAIEGSITDGGGFVDAPNDGQLYGRQSEAWAVVPTGGASSWNDLTDKPAEFPPEAHQHGWDQITGKPAEYPPASHNHDGVYQPAGDYIGEAPNDGEEYARKNQGWVKLQDHNYTGADAVKLTGDQSAAGHKTWTDVATFVDTVTMRGTLNGDDTANFQNAVTAGSLVKTGGTADQYLMADGSVSAGPEAGAAVQIGATFDGTPKEGDQWLETPAGEQATMWIYDGAKWLQMPGGKDGADGADSPWTDNGTSITYGTTTIEASGTNTMLGGRLVAYLSNNDTEVSLSFREIDGTEAVRYYTDEAANFSLWDGNLGINRMRLDADGNMFVAGAIYKNGSTPVMTSMDLIETLHTLRQATKDESTVEGLRDSIGNAIGGLIEKFEAMQAEAGNE